MPTIFRYMGYSIVVYPNDHTPAHVHAKTQGGELIIEIEGNVQVRELRGKIRKKDVPKLLAYIAQAENLAKAREVWNETRPDA